MTIIIKTKWTDSGQSGQETEPDAPIYRMS